MQTELTLQTKKVGKKHSTSVGRALKRVTAFGALLSSLVPRPPTVKQVEDTQVGSGYEISFCPHFSTKIPSFSHLRGCVYKNQTSSGKLRNLKISETLAISRPY